MEAIMKNVYLWKVGDHVVCHADLVAAAQLTGLTRQPDKTITTAEYEAADGIARIINGEIVIGKTPEEIAEQEEQEQISAYKTQLAQIDQDAVAGRAIRELVLALAEQAGIEGEAVDALRDYEAKAEPIRAELQPFLLKKSIK
jgi:hypothetical protein